MLALEAHAVLSLPRLMFLKYRSSTVPSTSDIPSVEITIFFTSVSRTHFLVTKIKEYMLLIRKLVVILTLSHFWAQCPVTDWSDRWGGERGDAAAAAAAAAGHKEELKMLS